MARMGGPVASLVFRALKKRFAERHVEKVLPGGVHTEEAPERSSPTVPYAILTPAAETLETFTNVARYDRASFNLELTCETSEQATAVIDSLADMIEEKSLDLEGAELKLLKRTGIIYLPRELQFEKRQLGYEALVGRFREKPTVPRPD